MEGTSRPICAASFGSFEVDFRAGELSRQGRRIRLQDQPLQVLAALLEHPGQVMTREELRKRLWPGDTFVDFDHGLNNAINRLREVLGDSAERPVYVETIPRRGYRFIAPVQMRDHGSRNAEASPSPPAAAIESADPQALEHYLRARPYFGGAKRDDNDAAITLLEKAVALDPNFAAAHAALGNAYRLRSTDVDPDNPEWEEKAFAAVERALQLDPSLTEGYVVRARLLWTPRNHWAHERAVPEFRRALTLEPTLSEAYHHLGDIYNHVGLLDRAADELRQAVALDAFNTAARFRLGVNLSYRGRYDESLTAMRDARRYNPPLWTFQTSFALFQLGRRDEATEHVAEFLRTETRDSPGGLLAGLQALFAAAEGDAATAERNVRDAMQGQGYSHFHHTEHIIAGAYATLGRPELAVKHLQRAADHGFPCYPLFERDISFDAVRRAPRFAEFMATQKAQWEQRTATL